MAQLHIPVVLKRKSLEKINVEKTMDDWGEPLFIVSIGCKEVRLDSYEFFDHFKVKRKFCESKKAYKKKKKELKKLRKKILGY